MVKARSIQFAFVVTLTSFVASAQQADTTYVYAADSAYAAMRDSLSGDSQYSVFIPDDSLQIDKRAFSETNVDALRQDADLNYEQAPTVGVSLWNRFLAWISRLIGSLFENAIETSWSRVLIYIGGLALIVIIIMMLLKVDAFKVIFFGSGAKQKYTVLEENIHEMDFEKLLAEAMTSQDYRRGVRLLFLYSLKLLSDRHMIQWEMGKTNRDYIAELRQPDLRPGFNQLSYYFDYAWYGNFRIDRNTFDAANQTFHQLKNKLAIR